MELDGVTEIGESTFVHSELRFIELPPTLRHIGPFAFQHSDLVSIDLSNTKITTIEHSTFENAALLVTVDLSNTNLSSIGEAAFFDCTSLSTINLSTTILSRFGIVGFRIVPRSQPLICQVHLPELGTEHF